MGGQKDISREEIFEHIERELLSNGQHISESVPYRVKNNYLMALFINALLLFLVLVGGLFVYLRFQASEYELVGKPESIRGLEEALYQELQKKIQQELVQKEAELASTKARLEEIQQKMTSYREELQKSFASELEKRRKELEQKLQEELKNASASERKQLLAQYEEERKRIEQTLQQELAKREEEYKKSLLEEQKRLLAVSSNQQAELQATKKQLSSVQSEYEERIRALQQTNQQALNLLRSELESKQRQELFRAQIEAEFIRAMQLIREGRYDEAQARLVQVSNLSAARPKDIDFSASQQLLDNLFVAVLQDYIQLKQKGIVQEVSPVSLKRLKTLADALQKGAYDKNTNQLKAEMEALARDLPEVFAFYSQYQDFLGRVQAEQIQKELKQADAFYAMKNYKAALVAYIALVKRYPLSKERDTVLNRLSQALSDWEAVKSQVVVSNQVVIYTNTVTNQGVKGANEEEAKRLFDTAVTLSKSEPQKALSAFVEVIEKQPASSYVKPSLEYIQRIYEKQFSQRGIEELQKQQETEAQSLYLQASSAYDAGNYQNAIALYQKLILSAPLSSYVDKSIEALDKAYYRLLVSRKKIADLEKSIVARVMTVEGDVLTLSLTGSRDLVMGQMVRIYHKVNTTEMEEVARASVTRVNQLIVQAKLTQSVDKVKIGDVVVGEEK